jgi:hypothetical protein
MCAAPVRRAPRTRRAPNSARRTIFPQIARIPGSNREIFAVEVASSSPMSACGWFVTLLHVAKISLNPYGPRTLHFSLSSNARMGGARLHSISA